MKRSDKDNIIFLGEVYLNQQIRTAEQLRLWSLASELILKKALFMKEIHINHEK